MSYAFEKDEKLRYRETETGDWNNGVFRGYVKCGEIEAIDLIDTYTGGMRTIHIARIQRMTTGPKGGKSWELLIDPN